jgi:hypothetical protein
MQSFFYYRKLTQLEKDRYDEDKQPTEKQN